MKHGGNYEKDPKRTGGKRNNDRRNGGDERDERNWGSGRGTHSDVTGSTPDSWRKSQRCNKKNAPSSSDWFLSSLLSIQVLARVCVCFVRLLLYQLLEPTSSMLGSFS